MLAQTGARLRDEFQGARFKSPLRDRRWGGDVMYQRRSAGKTACVGENRARRAVDSFSVSKGFVSRGALAGRGRFCRGTILVGW